MFGPGSGITALVVLNQAVGARASASIILERKAHHLEAKIAAAYFFGGYVFLSNLIPVVNIGYRFQKPESPVFFRITAKLMSGIGIGFGVAF